MQIMKLCPPYFNLPFNYFCTDSMYFSFYGKHLFACHLTRIFEFLTREMDAWFQSTEILFFL